MNIMSLLQTGTKRFNQRFSSLVCLVALGSLLALVAAGPAFAQSDPTNAQYTDQVKQVAGAGGGSSAAPAETSKPPALEQNVVTGLPITGLDLVALGAVALALTSMGFALRRLTGSEKDPS